MPRRYNFEDNHGTTGPVASFSEQSIDGVTTCCKPKLDKNVRLCGALSFIVGSMIGSGVFASGRAVAERTGSVGMILCVWSSCGIIATLGALCYAELGTAIPRSGSEYAYLKYAFGDGPAFLFAFVSMLILKPSTLAAICLAFGNYMTESVQLDVLCTSSRKLTAKIFAALAIGTANYTINDFPLLAFH